MKIWIGMFIVAAVLTFAIHQRGQPSESEATWQNGVDQVDSVLQEQGFTGETHDALSKRADESADWFGHFSSRVGGAVASE
jgi:hypothetical protein